MKNELKTYCELYWWNMGTKTLSFKGELKYLLKEQGVTFTRRQTKTDGVYTFYFKSKSGIRYQTNGLPHDFRHIAKQFIQMELVRMGDKSSLYVAGAWRPTVTVNF